MSWSQHQVTVHKPDYKVKPLSNLSVVNNLIHSHLLVAVDILFNFGHFKIIYTYSYMYILFIRKPLALNKMEMQREEANISRVRRPTPGEWAPRPFDPKINEFPGLIVEHFVC